MNPSAGSFVINPRLQRLFLTLAMDFPGQDSLMKIYGTFLAVSWGLAANWGRRLGGCLLLLNGSGAGSPRQVQAPRLQGHDSPSRCPYQTPHPHLHTHACRAT